MRIELGQTQLTAPPIIEPLIIRGLILIHAIALSNFFESAICLSITYLTSQIAIAPAISGLKII